MKTLITILVVLAVAASAPLAMAGGSDISIWQQRKAAQAQQQQFDQYMDRIDMDAAMALSATPAGKIAGKSASAARKLQPKRMYCLADCL